MVLVFIVSTLLVDKNIYLSFMQLIEITNMR